MLAKELAQQLRVQKNSVAYRCIKAGLKYGYPACCIAFYVLVWMPLVDALIEAGGGKAMPDYDMASEPMRMIMGIWADYFELIDPQDAVPRRLPERIYCPACALQQQHLGKLKI